MISAIVLAAGTSSRMGRPKPLIRVRGRPLLEHVLTTIRNSSVGQTVVVLGHEADRIQEDIPLDDVTVVLNRDYAEGMSTSIKAGLRALDSGTEAAFVVLADQPFVSPSTLDTLSHRWTESDAKILIPTFRGVRGNPVLLDLSLSHDLQSISGDQGCRGIFGHHQDDILEVPVDDPSILLDLDTKTQLDHVLAAVERGEDLESLVADAVAIGAEGPDH